MHTLVFISRVTNISQRMASQIEHLANAYATGYDYDLGERELGIAQNFDRDLDNIAAPVALINSRLLELLDDEGKCFSS